MRYLFIHEEEKAFPVTLLCKTMNVSRSGYYAWTKRGESKHSQENRKLADIVKSAHIKSKASYGARRHADEIASYGQPCGRFRARTIMNIAKVEAKQKKRFKATTDSNHKMKVSPNLLNREFSVQAPNKAWVSDITYISTSEGWLYLAVVIDLFNREVVGWALDQRINRHLVINAVRMAVWRQKPDKGLMFHSDRGSQYCSRDFTKYIKGHGMLSSMSRKGDCWDNAVAESYFSSLKKERVYSEIYRTRREAKSDIVDYIEMFYNSFRRHSHLGNVNPREFRKQWLADKMAA
ncbi:MAG: IS3 family transposase [Proteobacteria bacterium]|nr:IS3 family transposase [Pseudomonadota bacterium]